MTLIIPTLNSNLITLNLYFDQGADVAAGKLSGHVVVRDDHKDGSYTATVIRPSPGSWSRLGIGLVLCVCVYRELGDGGVDVERTQARRGARLFCPQSTEQRAAWSYVYLTPWWATLHEHGPPTIDSSVATCSRTCRRHAKSTTQKLNTPTGQDADSDSQLTTTKANRRLISC